MARVSATVRQPVKDEIRKIAPVEDLSESGMVERLIEEALAVRARRATRQPQGNPGGGSE